MAEDRQIPRNTNMQALLKFCTELTVAEDAPNVQVPPMDAERQEFLKNVLDCMTVNNAKKIAGRLQELSQFNAKEDHNDEDIESIEMAMEDLSSVIEDLDNANDLVKMGGVSVLLESLKSPVSIVRELSCEIIGEIAQNNPLCQQEIISSNVLEKLLLLIDNDHSMSVKIKALYATSSTVRSYEPGSKKFEELDGFSCLMRAMQTDSEKLFIKSAFLISNLIKEYSHFKDTMLSMGYTELLVSRLCGKVDDSKSGTDTFLSSNSLCREHCTCALLELCSLSEEARTICQNTTGLVEVLMAREEIVKDKEEHQEEAEYIKELIKLLNISSEDPSISSNIR